MVTISKIPKFNHFEKPYPESFYKECYAPNTNKKGLITPYCYKPLVFMVGTIGFEPTTSTVSR